MSSGMNQWAILSPIQVRVSTPAKAPLWETPAPVESTPPTTSTRVRTFSKTGECLAGSIFKKSVCGVQSYQ